MFKRLLTKLKSWIGISELSDDTYSISAIPPVSEGDSTFDAIVASLPPIVGDDERIARVIFSPDNIEKANRDKAKFIGVRPNTFRSRGGEDDLSTNRFDYMSTNLCKEQGKKLQNPGKKDYFGIAILLASEIREVEGEIEHTPDRENDNPYHSSIRTGFITEVGAELSGKKRQIVNAMAKRARAYKDEDPTGDSWVGETNLI